MVKLFPKLDVLRREKTRNTNLIGPPRLEGLNSVFLSMLPECDVEFASSSSSCRCAISMRSSFDREFLRAYKKMKNQDDLPELPEF